MQKIFRKIFGLYAGEGRQALRFARLAVLWAFGSSCLDTLSDGLFLERVGAPFLPRVYLLVALAMLGVSTLVLYSLRRRGPYQILTLAIGSGALICLGGAFALLTPSPPEFFWYALKISAKVFFAVMIACSWTFIDQYHDLQDAKRVYALYGASYFLGTIFAGAAIHWLLNLIGFSGLLICSALFLGYALLQARAITQKTSPLHDDTSEGIFSASRDSLPQMVRLIFRSRFSILLLLMSLFIQLLITVTEFNYMDTFGRFFQTKDATASIGEGEIAEFLGRSRALIACGNLFVGVFLYNRCVRKIGLHNVLLITPLFFFGVYMFWVFQDSMAFALLGLIAVDGILFTVEDNSFNLLSNAVPPKLRSKVRIINDSFFEPVGMLLSSLLLFGLSSGGLWLGISLAGVVLGLSVGIRAIYSEAIFINLKENALHFERKLRDWLGLSTRREQKEMRKDILKALKDPSDETRLLAIEALLELKELNTVSDILDAARGLGTLSKIQLLRLFDQSIHSTHPLVIETVDLWLKESASSELAKWANLYLAKRGLHHPDKGEVDLDHSDLFLRGAAILTLKKSLANQTLEYAALNKTIATKKLERMLSSSHIDEISMGLDILGEEKGGDAAEKAFSFLSHESLLVKRAAARCLAQVVDKSFSRHAPRLIEELENARDNTFRLSLLAALGKVADSTTIRELLLASVYFRPSERRKTEEILIGIGLKIVPLLLSLTKEVALPERARLLASKILSRLALPQLQANLIDILDIEIDRAYFYFYFAHTIQNQYPLYDLKMLENALLTGYQSVIDFIIHLLGAAGSLEDPDLLVRALHARNPKVHSHAVESLEKTCDTRIFNLIAPLVDDLPLEEKMAACLRWRADYPQLSLSELLAGLDRSPSLFDKIVSAKLKATLQMPHWREQLLDQMKHSDEEFYQYAYELLKI